METKYWICDHCEQHIKAPEHGWVEWISLGVGKPGRGLRLVHHAPHSPAHPYGSCQYKQGAEYSKDKGVVGDDSLAVFLSPEGYMALLDMLGNNDLPADEIIEMLKRLYIPGYEIVRRFLGIAVAEGVFEETSRRGFPTQGQMEAVLKWVNNNGLMP